MTGLAVWAPRARRVDATTSEGDLALEPSGRGWWSSPRAMRPGVDYGFRLDGGEALPDPRSRWQPAGVFGPSRLVDPEGYVWGDAGFRATPLDRAVLYELHVGTFSREGTFRGAIRHLDALAELGITHVELMPVAAFSGERGWGYDGVLLFAPHPAYGAPDDLKALVDACHGRGLAVIFDVVHNHFGAEGNVLPRFGPYLSERHHTPWGQAPNLDGPDSSEVRRYLIESALAWLRDYHGDGLRLDAVHALIDLSAFHLVEELARDVASASRALGRPLVVMAESDANDPRLVVPPARGGFGLDAIWDDDFHHALHACLTGESAGYYADFGGLRQLEKAYARGFVYAGEYSAYRRRRQGRPAPELSGEELVGFAQNHDQVGNRARGDRLSFALATPRLLLAAGLVLTAPFVPLLFQGEEWASSSPFLYFCDPQDPSLAEATRKGRLAEFEAFGWEPEEIADPCAPDTFMRSKLAWEERELPRHRAVLDGHRALVRLRRRLPDLRDPTLRPDLVQYSADDGWLRLRRGRCQVVANFSERPARVPVEADADQRLLFSSPDGVELEGTSLLLPPDGFAVLGPKLGAEGDGALT